MSIINSVSFFGNESPRFFLLQRSIELNIFMRLKIFSSTVNSSIGNALPKSNDLSILLQQCQQQNFEESCLPVTNVQ